MLILNRIEDICFHKPTKDELQAFQAYLVTKCEWNESCIGCRYLELGQALIICTLGKLVYSSIDRCVSSRVLLSLHGDKVKLIDYISSTSSTIDQLDKIWTIPNKSKTRMKCFPRFEKISPLPTGWSTEQGKTPLYGTVRMQD